MKNILKRIQSILVVLLVFQSICAFSNDCISAFRNVKEFRYFIQYLIEEADNRHFELVARNGEKGYVFFHVENAIMKALNEHFLRDRELSAASSSLMRQIVMNLIRKNNIQPVAVYADYKSIRIAFKGGEDKQILVDKLRNIFLEATKEFERQFLRFKELSGFSLPPISTWHLAGIGDSADSAAIISRLNRQNGISVSVYDESLEKTLKDIVIRIENLRAQLQRQISLNKLFEDNNGLKLLSYKTLYLLRALVVNQSKIDLETVRQKIKAIFNVTISPEETSMLVEYMNLLNIFSPPIYEEKEYPDLNLSRTQHGMVVIDIRGQGARNLLGVAHALALGQQKSIQDLLIDIRREQDMESEMFLKKRRNMESAFRGLKKAKDFQGVIHFSGDDAVFIPERRNLTKVEKILIVEGLSELSYDYRLSFIESNFIDTHTHIPIKQRMELISIAENIEKSLRLLTQEEPRLIFGIEILPRKNGTNLINIIIGGNPSVATLSLIKRTCKKIELPAGFEISEILSLITLQN